MDVGRIALCDSTTSDLLSFNSLNCAAVAPQYPRPQTRIPSQISSAPPTTSLPPPSTHSFPSMRLLPPLFQTPLSSPSKPYTHRPKSPLQPLPLLSKDLYPYTIHRYPTNRLSTTGTKKEGILLAGCSKGCEEERWESMGFCEST